VEMKDLKNSPPVGIKRVSHHPDFAVINVTGNLDAVPDNNDQWANDIAILELDQNITWSPLVQPACLPQPQHEAELYEDGRMALSSGWGGINQRYPDDVVDVLQLHYARMNVYNSQTCYNHLVSFCDDFMRKHILQAGASVNWDLNQYRSIYPELLSCIKIQHFQKGQKEAFWLTDDKICAFNIKNGAAACNGDSGSALIVDDVPLTPAAPARDAAAPAGAAAAAAHYGIKPDHSAAAAPARNRATIIGVVHSQPGFFLPGVSACPQPGDHHYPILYTKVLKYLPWIESVLKVINFA